MNDREMLERVYAAMDRCPLCNLYGHEHEDGCPLHIHLHPETVVGSWQWVEAQGKAGKKVRRRGWANIPYVHVKDGAWVMDDGSPCRSSKPGYPDDGDGNDWELYVSPTPKLASQPPKPETVRWALVLNDDCLRTTASGCAGLPAMSLVDHTWDGRRLSHFLGHTADGREVEMGCLTMGYAGDEGPAYATERPFAHEKVWADTALMEKVDAD